MSLSDRKVRKQPPRTADHEIYYSWDGYRLHFKEKSIFTIVEHPAHYCHCLSCITITPMWRDESTRRLHPKIGNRRHVILEYADEC